MDPPDLYQAPYYTERIDRDPKLLALTASEVAQSSGIPEWVVAYFFEHPDEIPRPDYWPRLERALLLPPGYFSAGGAYPPITVLARLRHYHRRGIVHAWTLAEGEHTWSSHRLNHADDQSRFELLARIEIHLSRGRLSRRRQP